ncbi:DNA-binding CsgD family transcriptional regulator [Duganella sp. 1224]|uniref:helix-turn-helix transcriptional regulator n=1 Tax=Duganella sp. 1224 TaxID=2587052 RepID=UPI0015CAB25B|nr:helix-turn-helix transcriptional regulator [Duganella sp. 1224]NYE62381.1 DNA-binding CsgD family transcriptional regulator [Duganella sp. 1224]
MPQTLTSQAAAVYLGAALNRMDTAVLLIDAELCLLHANQAATALLERDTALRLDGRKLMQDAGCGAQSLARAVAAALADGHGAAQRVLSLPRGGRQPLLLAVAPFLPPAALPALPACAIVLAIDPDAYQLSGKLLMQLFDLTPAEAGVALALAHGDALEDIAAALDISLHTVKTHLHKLFRKTGTRRQGELVAMLHRDAGRFGAASIV